MVEMVKFVQKLTVYRHNNYALTLMKHYFSKATIGLLQFVNIWRKGLRGSVVNW